MGEDERAELVRQLFAVMTAMLEDGAALAADGQGAAAAVAADLAGRIAEIGRHVAVIADAAAELA